MTTSSSSAPEPTYLGSCLCRGVRYEVQGPIDRVSHCHCSMCRKVHGAAFATHGTVRTAQHRVVEGEALLRLFRSSPEAERIFCSACGSPMVWRSHDARFAGWLSFPLGSLDTPFVAPAHRHIYVNAKAPWFEITDHWPQAQIY